MSQSQEAQSTTSQNFTLPGNSYAVLDAYDSLALARCSEIYLQALEHYILINVVDFPVQDELLRFLRLYCTESAKGLKKTADILKAALEQGWEQGDE